MEGYLRPEFGELKRCVWEFGRQEKEFEQTRDRITTDSEADHLVAGGEKAEESGEDARCRAGGHQRYKGEPDTALPQGAWSSLGNLDTGRSTSREENHVMELRLP